MDLDDLDKIRKNADLLNDFAVNDRYPGDYGILILRKVKKLFI